MRFRHFWGVNKRQELLESLSAKNFAAQYRLAKPSPANRFSFRPERVSDEYRSWPKVTELAAEAPINGLMEKRGGALIDIDRSALAKRMRKYFERSVLWNEFARDAGGLAVDAASFDAAETRVRAQQSETYQDTRICRYSVRPFETRWCYYSVVPSLWNRPRPPFWEQLQKPNAFLLSRFKASKSPEGSPFYFTRLLADDHLLSPDAVCFPLKLLTRESSHTRAEEQKDGNLQFNTSTATRLRPNASAKVTTMIAEAGRGDGEDIFAISEKVWHHVLAIGYAPAYLTENEDGIRQDWPRIPLPARKEDLV